MLKRSSGTPRGTARERTPVRACFAGTESNTVRYPQVGVLIASNVPSPSAQGCADRWVGSRGPPEGYRLLRPGCPWAPLTPFHLRVVMISLVMPNVVKLVGPMAIKIWDSYASDDRLMFVAVARRRRTAGFFGPRQNELVDEQGGIKM